MQLKLSVKVLQPIIPLTTPRRRGASDTQNESLSPRLEAVVLGGVRSRRRSLDDGVRESGSGVGAANLRTPRTQNPDQSK